MRLEKVSVFTSQYQKAVPDQRCASRVDLLIGTGNTRCGWVPGRCVHAARHGVHTGNVPGDRASSRSLRAERPYLGFLFYSSKVHRNGWSARRQVVATDVLCNSDDQRGVDKQGQEDRKIDQRNRRERKVRAVL